MASRDDDSSGVRGEHRSPPQCFGCFIRTFRRKRKQMQLSSTTAAADSTAAVSGGTWMPEEAQSLPNALPVVVSTSAKPRSPRGQIVSWDVIPLDKDYEVLSYLPSFYDRCKLRCVSLRWRNATRMDPPRPLPLVVTADFCLLNVFADGLSSAAREIKLPEQQPRLAQRIACVGSLDSWLVCVCPREWDARKSMMLSDLKCFLLEPSRQRLVLLPDPPAHRLGCCIYDGLVQIENSSATMRFTEPVSEVEISLIKAVVTMPSDIGACKVAAISERRGRGHLALCTTGMHYWVLCSSVIISLGTDLEFFEGKLYLLSNYQAELYSLDFGPDFRCFPLALHAEKCLIDLPFTSEDNTWSAFSLVLCGTRLLLIIRKFPKPEDDMFDVNVYVLDKRSIPWRWNEIQTLEGNCILISSGSNKSFPALLYDEVEEDAIYFMDSVTPGFLPNVTESFSYSMIVYSMRNRSVIRRHIGSKLICNGTKFPLWYCPSQ